MAARLRKRRHDCYVIGCGEDADEDTCEFAWVESKISELLVKQKERELKAVRLTTAAPELLEALYAIHNAFLAGEIKWKHPRQSDSDPYHPANVKMSAAIAKAEGR